MPIFSLILLIVSERNIEYFFENLPFMSPRQPIKSSYLDKSRMQHGGLLNKHICENKSDISSETAETVNFQFSHYKSMGTISCHSNQSSYPTRIKNNFCIGLCPKHVCQVSASSPLMVSEKKIFKAFLRKLTLFAAPTTNQIHRFEQKSYET